MAGDKLSASNPMLPQLTKCDWLPVNVQRLEQLYMTGEFSDVDISIEGHGLIAWSHKVILVLTRFCVAPPRLRYYSIGAEAIYDANKEIKLDASIPKAYLRKG
ncbi:BTB/Kelch-associated [Artemisia annua]|uniref:BTB/Kelch-associated n=1 Tax=Artemisia annua TaxID=35608 RepID=A0A2U1NSQ5_ARTAN|nr:BTB/Kelch-associated [Artemisia annua]